MNTTKAIELCKKLEEHAPAYGLHVALTGGCLYKEGDRKDVDIILYRIRQVIDPDRDGFYKKMKDLSIFTITGYYGWVTKAITPDGINIDLFDPENRDDGDY